MYFLCVLKPKTFVSQRNVSVAKLGWTCAVLAAIGMFSILVQAATHTENRVQTHLMPNVIICYNMLYMYAVCSSMQYILLQCMFADVVRREAKFQI